ncbi:hypothetical protein G6L37_00820 [Agrobacterium rubi]|nr:hypothetical protein [Agrobacterium rubi]NTF23933.1 hypothetical protein [Agrobacterium rubi]
MGINDTLREEVERHLDDQAEILSAVRVLIEEKIPFEEWAEIERDAFVMALQPSDDASAFEVMKAHNLYRHLFRQPVEPILLTPSGFDRPDLADRIRADLAGLIRLGAGRYLRNDIVTASPSISPA